VSLTAGANGSSNTSKHIVKGNYLETSNSSSIGGSTIRVQSSTGARFGDLEISDNTINAGWNGLALVSQYVAGSLVIKNNKFGGVANNYMANLSSLTGSPAAVMDNIFDSIAGASGFGLQATTDVIHMANNKFINRTSGSVPMLTLTNSCGTIIGTQFNNVVQPAQITAGGLGTSNPSGCTLNYNDFVQNLTPAEAGAGGSKYVEFGWLHASTTTSTTHLPQRALTGN
jgi:hypothetical protein